MYHGTREYTIKLLDMVDEGILDPKAALEACLCYMAEYQVEDMMRVNDFLLEEEDEEDAEDLLDNFNYVGSRHHY